MSPRAGGPLAAFVSWLVVLTVLTVVLVSGLLAGPGSGRTPPVPAPASAPVPASASGAMAPADEIPPPGLFGVAARPLMVAATPMERAQLEGSLRSLAQSPADRLRLAVLLAELEARGGAPDDPARARAARILESVAGQPAGSALHAHARWFARLYAGPGPGPAAPGGAGADPAVAPLTAEEREQLIRHHGDFARLALTTGLPDSDPARAPIFQRARDAVAFALMVGVGFAGVVVVSAGLFITAMVLRASGRLGPRPLPAFLAEGVVVDGADGAKRVGGSGFIEAFAVFLVGLVLLPLAEAWLEPVIGPGLTLQIRWLLLGAFVWPLRRGMTRARLRAGLGWHVGSGPVREILAGVVGYVALLPLVGVGLVLMLALRLVFADPGAPLPTHPLGQMLAGAGVWQVVALVVLATLWAPIVEETAFRGALYAHLRPRLGAVVSGLLSGLIFAALHPQGWMGIPVLTALALNFALLREWRGSLIAPITAHAVNNGAITALLLVMLNL